MSKRLRDDEVDSNRVYVGNLPYHVSWQDLKDKFRECGTVAYANVELDLDGRSKGWGIVEFERAEEAARAINRLNDTNLGGRNMYVRMDRVGDTRDVRQLRQQGRGPASSGGGRRCYVNNLAWQTGWQDLKDRFREAGRVVHADVMVDEKGHSKGWGIVEFETTQEALNAISKLNEAELHGRLLQVREDKEDRGAPPVRAVANSAARMRSEVHSSLASVRPSHSSVRGTGDSRCRCYVGNLAWQTGWKDLKDVFREAGRVVHADVMLDETGRSKGCGIVEFETEDEARMAIARLHDRELHGRLMHVREDREEVSRTGIAKLRSGGQVLRVGRCYVGNLAYTTTWQVLKDKFKTAGRVLHADVVSDETGCSKGFGLVEFETEDEAARAIAMLNDSELDGRRMYVREDRVDNNGSTGGSRVAGIQPSRYEGTDHATSCQGGGGRLGGRGRCYVGNLAWQTGWQDLKDKFREAGRVVHADVMLDETGRSKGYGIIEFETEEEVIRAISNLNGTELGGRRIHVREDRVEQPPSNGGVGGGYHSSYGGSFYSGHDTRFMSASGYEGQLKVKRRC